MNTATTRGSRVRKADEARRAKHAVPDGAKAFQVIADMEDDIRNVERAANALRVIASSNLDESEQDAVYLISEALRLAHQGLDEKYRHAWHATWGYVHGDQVQDRDADMVTSP